MFTKKSEWGDHSIFRINNISKYGFNEYFRKLYNCKTIPSDTEGNIDFTNTILNNLYNSEKNINGSDTELHHIFYNDIKTNDNKFS